jgi:nitrite reductase (NADH) small subunit
MVEILGSLKSHQVDESEVKVWFKAASVHDFPGEGGACVKYKDLQIAVFNFNSGKEWYACQNLCPHKMQMILSRGLTGSHENEPKVACPFHKKTFSLKTGECLNAEEEAIATFPVKVKDDYIYIGFSK